MFIGDLNANIRGGFTNPTADYQKLRLEIGVGIECQRFRPFSSSAPRGFGPFPVRPFSISALMYFFALLQYFH